MCMRLSQHNVCTQTLSPSNDALLQPLSYNLRTRSDVTDVTSWGSSEWPAERGSLRYGSLGQDAPLSVIGMG